MSYKGYLIDLDGVAYLGTKVIPTCRDFVSRCHENKIPFCFVTNNSTRTTEEVWNHLTILGYHVTKENIITSSEVTAHYLRSQNKGNRVFLIGMNGIQTELIQAGFELVEESPDYVVVGLDKQLTYDRLTKAGMFIRNGVPFISTNSDLRLSTSIGVTPGNGAICKVLELTTNVAPIYMGKPESAMFWYALEKLGLKKEEVAMIGDNYLTDILGALQIGMDSIFVETGIMTQEEIDLFDRKPTLCVKDLSKITI